MFRSSATHLIFLMLLWIATFGLSTGTSQFKTITVGDERERQQRVLKMGMMGKGKQSDDDVYLDDDEVYINSTTALPSETAAPSSYSTKSCKKIKKSNKSKKEKKSDKGKKKGKDKGKGKKKEKECESQSPSLPPTNATTAPIGATTTSPMTTITTTAPALPGTNAPALNPTNTTSTPTAQPSIQSKSKKKSKKNGKGGGKGKGMMSSNDEGFQSQGISSTTQPPATSSMLRSKAAALPTSTKSSVFVDTTKTPGLTTRSPIPNSPTIPTSTEAPSKSTTSKAPTKVAAPSFTLLLSPSPSSASPTSVSSLFDEESKSAIPSSTEVTEIVDATPFQLVYNISLPISNGRLSKEQINEVVDLTFTYMNDFFVESYDGNTQIFYNSLIGSRIAHSVDFTTIQYMASAQFINPGVGPIPTTSDIDTLIAMAFRQPSVITLFDLLRNLPPQNPYSQTSNILYSYIAIQTTPSNTAAQEEASPDKSSGKSAVATGVGITGAVLLLCFVTGTVALYRNGYFTKKQGKNNTNKSKYSKAPKNEISDVVLDDTERPSCAEENDNEDDSADEDSLSDCTSSVSSCPPSSSSTTSTIDNANKGVKNRKKDDSYRNRILEDDVEIKFVYPHDGNDNLSETCYPALDDDPLFPVSPGSSKKGVGHKKRQNV